MFRSGVNVFFITVFVLLFCREGLAYSLNKHTNIDLSGITESDKVSIVVPDNIENGAVIPIIVSSSAVASSVTLFSDRHPDFVFNAEFKEDSIPYVSTRFRGGASLDTLFAVSVIKNEAIYSLRQINIEKGVNDTEYAICPVSDIKVVKKEVVDGVEIKMLFSACMDESHYINNLRLFRDDKLSIEVKLTPAISQNPFFGFKFKSNGVFRIEWETVDGEKGHKVIY